jgi:putative redox protein
MKTTTSWLESHHFESRQDKHTIQLDGSVQSGFSPKALLLSGLAACSGIDLIDILTKMKVPFTGLVIDTEAEQTTEHPRVFKDILVTYTIKTDLQHEDKVKKAISLSLDKYCGVSAMLKKNSAITYKLVIN